MTFTALKVKMLVLKKHDLMDLRGEKGIYFQFCDLSWAMGKNWFVFVNETVVSVNRLDKVLFQFIFCSGSLTKRILV